MTDELELDHFVISRFGDWKSGNREIKKQIDVSDSLNACFAQFSLTNSPFIRRI